LAIAQLAARVEFSSRARPGRIPMLRAPSLHHVGTWGSRLSTEDWGLAL